MRTSVEMIRLAALAIGMLIGFCSVAQAERVALVIGNSNFMQADDLVNPGNDATDIAARLADLGFDIHGGGAQLDVTRAQMTTLFNEFEAKLQDGDLAVIFFAGHGAQYQGENYLIPVDDKALNFAEELPDMAYSASALVRQMTSRSNVTSIIILDACRNNALPSALADGKSLPHYGLAQMDVPDTSFSLIMFAAASGSTASDGRGRNSPFTAAFLQALEQPVRRMEDIVRDVRRMVRLETNGEQVPWSNSSLETDVYLMPPSVVDQMFPQDPVWQLEAYTLLSALSTSDPVERLTALCDMRQLYPSGASAMVLDDLIADLEKRLDGREESHGACTL